MNQHQSSSRAIPDVPLPGMYECLTAQLNVTLHPQMGTAKWILALRDPSPNRQVELSREGGVTPWTSLPEVLAAAVQRLSEGLAYLGGLPAAHHA